MFNDNVLATLSIVITAPPVPGDAFAGDSLGPFMVTTYVITDAYMLDPDNKMAAKHRFRSFIEPPKNCPSINRNSTNLSRYFM